MVHVKEIIFKGNIGYLQFRKNLSHADAFKLYIHLKSSYEINW